MWDYVVHKQLAGGDCRAATSSGARMIPSPDTALDDGVFAERKPPPPSRFQNRVAAEVTRLKLRELPGIWSFLTPVAAVWKEPAMSCLSPISQRPTTIRITGHAG